MNCGMEATIIAYKNANDIDIQFEDGTVITSRGYNSFCQGEIKNPNLLSAKHIGESHMMNCGMQATIIVYRKSDDLDVQFVDGTIVTNKSYKSFCKGGIANPNYNAIKQKRIGETRMMNCGMEATIIAYRKAIDIDIQFEDGTVITNRMYDSFYRGEINNPNLISLNRVGETNTMNCGMQATIIKYRRSDDLDVQFEDGTVVENKSYKSFRKGEIANPNYNHKSNSNIRLGETRIMNCGLKAEIIRYYNCEDMDVRFEDNSIAYHCKYVNFKRGTIANPSLGRNYTQKSKNRIGEKRIMKNGLEATIIAYESATNIDIVFEDGTVVQHKTYDCFLKGSIAKPIIDRVGEKRQMKCGMNAEIVAYRSSGDIDVLFDDGTLVTGRTYSLFQAGQIANPHLGKYAAVSYKYQSRVGEKNVMNNGMVATIIEYKQHNDITIEFEDGTVVEKTRYNAFKKGSVLNPNNVVTSESLYEGVILYYLSDYGFYHFKAKDMKNIGLGRYEVDVFNPTTHDGIEVDGPFHKMKKDIKKNSQFYRSANKKLIRIRDISLPKLDDSMSVDFYIDMRKGPFSKEYEGAIKKVFMLLDIKTNVKLQKDRDEIAQYYYHTHLNKRVGEKNMMNCGMEATIIAYRLSNDIDVQFIDGTVVKNKGYGAFQKGEIYNPNIKVGEKRLMNCGMEATIIAYRSATDIDLKFEDGTVLTNREYYRFCQGEIKNPNLLSAKHIGETNRMNCGMQATIIAYRRSDDLDVQFEDGIIVTNRSYKSFRKGGIANPNYNAIEQKRIGETRMMNCGLEATIIAYRSSDDIDVMFSDKEIAMNKSYGNFKDGRIIKPSLGQNAAITYKHQRARLGEEKTMNCGMKARIIEYRSFKDIDICFDDGTIVTNRTYDQFRKGSIANPSL